MGDTVEITLPLDPVEDIPRLAVTMADLRRVIKDEISSVTHEIDARIDARLDEERARTAKLVEERIDASEIRMTASINVLGDKFKNTLERIEAQIGGVLAVVNANQEIKQEQRKDIDRNQADIRAHSESLGVIASSVKRIESAIFGSKDVVDGPETLFGSLNGLKMQFTTATTKQNMRLDMLETWQREYQRRQAEVAARNERILKAAGFIFTNPVTRWVAVVGGGTLLGVGGFDLLKLFIGG